MKIQTSSFCENVRGDVRVLQTFFPHCLICVATVTALPAKNPMAFDVPPATVAHDWCSEWADEGNSCQCATCQDGFEAVRAEPRLLRPANPRTAFQSGNLMAEIVIPAMIFSHDETQIACIEATKIPRAHIVTPIQLPSELVIGLMVRNSHT